jgi:PAS domain S-box-containing protein
VQLGVFALVALGMNLLAAERGRAAGVLRRSRDDLERRVEVRTSELDEANKALEAGAEVRQRAEEALSQFAAIEASTEDAVLAIQLDGTIVSCNAAVEKLYGLSIVELVGRSIAVLFPPDVASKLPQMLEQVSRGETIAPFESVRQPVKGRPHQLLLTISPIKDAAGSVRGVCALVRDISKRKLAEKRIKLYQQQLRGLVSALSFAEQRERRRIAAELHDHLAQLLLLCKMKIGILQAAPTPEEIHKPIEEIRLLLDESIDYTRTLIWDLCPPMLHEVGLEAALEWLAEQIQERHGINVRFEDDEQPKASDENVRVLLFHAVNELLMNVIKHANASRAVVAVRKREEHVEIHVEDDGVGFDTEGVRVPAGQDGGFGLFSIRERLDVIGGSFEMSSSPGVGSRATLRAPLRPMAALTTRQEAHHV